MEFEWNPLKSAENLAKHGISFEDALIMWTGLTVEVDEVAKSTSGELRCATLGLVTGILYTAIWTVRGGRVRLISVRRPRDGEAKVYFEKVEQIQVQQFSGDQDL
jgi:uncharacterized DUF497 family protein